MRNVITVNSKSGELLGVLWFDYEANTVKVTDRIDDNPWEDGPESKTAFSMLVHQMVDGVSGNDSAPNYVLAQLTRFGNRGRYVVNTVPMRIIVSNFQHQIS